MRNIQAGELGIIDIMRLLAQEADPREQQFYTTSMRLNFCHCNSQLIG